MRFTHERSEYAEAGMNVPLSNGAMRIIVPVCSGRRIIVRRSITMLSATVLICCVMIREMERVRMQSQERE